MRGPIAAKIDRLLAKPIRHLFETPQKILKSYVKPGMMVLDVGCGSGYFSLGICRLVGPTGRVVSVDTDADHIEVLSKKADRAGLSDRIEVRMCHDRDLAIDDLIGQFDFALAVYVIHHAKDVICLMKNVQKALKPNGKFLVIEPKHHASPDDQKALRSKAREAGFTVAEHPRLKRDWAVVFVKDQKERAQRNFEN